MAEDAKVTNGKLAKLSALEELVLEHKKSLGLSLVKDKTEKELKESYKKIKDNHIAAKQMRTQIKKAKTDILEPAKKFTEQVNQMAKSLDDELVEVIDYLTPLRAEYEAEEKERKAKEKAKKEAEELAKQEKVQQELAEKESALQASERKIRELEAKLSAKFEKPEPKSEETTNTNQDVGQVNEPVPDSPQAEYSEANSVVFYIENVLKGQELIEISEYDSKKMIAFKTKINDKVVGFNDKVEAFKKSILVTLNKNF